MNWLLLGENPIKVPPTVTSSLWCIPRQIGHPRVQSSVPKIPPLFWRFFYASCIKIGLSTGVNTERRSAGKAQSTTLIEDSVGKEEAIVSQLSVFEPHSFSRILLFFFAFVLWRSYLETSRHLVGRKGCVGLVTHTSMSTQVYLHAQTSQTTVNSAQRTERMKTEW